MTDSLPSEPVEEQPEPAQPMLPLAIDGGQLSFFSKEEENEVRGLSTGEGLYQRDRRMYDLVVALLGQDAPIRSIKALTRLHHRTIMAVREREGETIDTLRKSLGRRALRTAVLAVETLEERIMSGDIKSGELAMTAGILIDKGQVLTGGVTSRTESVQGERIEDRLKDLLGNLPAADATLIEDGTGLTGIGAGKMAAIGLGPDGDVEQPADGCEDLQSSVSYLESGHVASHVATGPQKMPLGSADRGEGDSNKPGGEGGAVDGPPIIGGIGQCDAEFLANGDEPQPEDNDGND